MMIKRQSLYGLKNIFLYGSSLALLLILLKWLDYKFIIYDYALEFYIGAIAIIFTILGIWLALKLIKPKTVIVEQEVIVPAGSTFALNETELDRLGISRRELEVLQLMAQGYSNNEIADRLYVSLNTIKTHNSNLFFKMDVKRRTQAIEKAKKLSLVP